MLVFGKNVTEKKSKRFQDGKTYVELPYNNPYLSDLKAASAAKIGNSRKCEICGSSTVGLLGTTCSRRCAQKKIQQKRSTLL